MLVPRKRFPIPAASTQRIIICWQFRCGENCPRNMRKKSQNWVPQSSWLSYTYVKVNPVNPIFSVTGLEDFRYLISRVHKPPHWCDKKRKTPTMRVPAAFPANVSFFGRSDASSSSLAQLCKSADCLASEVVLEKWIPRESKDQTLPIGSRESFIWIILKTILCLVLDFQGICFRKKKETWCVHDRINEETVMWDPDMNLQEELMIEFIPRADRWYIAISFGDRIYVIN